jgi:hypothetical protein
MVPFPIALNVPEDSFIVLVAFVSTRFVPDPRPFP